MADISRGPVSTLPGARNTPPAGAMCDDHEDRPAIKRVQGETDSFGCEYSDLCAECVAEVDRYSALGRIGTCDWCKQQADDLRPRRDYEEGSSGRVYDVCGDCVKREILAHEEDRDRDDYDGDWL